MGILKRLHLVLVFITVTVAIPVYGFSQEGPLAFYLTWTEDPTSTMTVDWHSMEGDPKPLNFREKGVVEWQVLESSVLTYPFSDRLIHRVGLSGLKAETAYEIRFAGSETLYYFRTMPKTLDKSSLKIAIGGDSMHQKQWLEKTNKVVASFDPDFIIIGGDMAYENGLADNIQRIYDWFDAYKNTLVTEDNRILPCIVAAGNHEVVKGYHFQHEEYVQNDAFRSNIAPYFYSLFPFPGQPGYNVLDFGKYLSLIILDTEHSNPILGEQTRWLRRILRQRNDVLHKIPVYHVPAYPSVRDYNDKVQTSVRENWTPVFEENGVRLAFENHDHAYKRTYPIKDMEINQSGIVYLGDGSWGVDPRDIHDVAETWYLKKAQKVRAFTLLTLEGSQLSLISVDEDGNIIDSFPESPLVLEK